MNRILLLAVAIVFNVSAFSQEREVNIVDREKYDALIKRFELNEAEFDGITWYWHKKSPDYNQGGIFCYFGIKDHKLTPLRFGINYVSSSWLFIKRVRIKILGKVYDFPLTNVIKRETVDRSVGPGIRERIDERVTNANIVILNELLSVMDIKDVIIKLEGDYDENFMGIVWPKRLQAFKETVELYKAMGGTY